MLYLQVKHPTFIKNLHLIFSISSCLLHKEGPSYLPLPKQISISPNSQSEPCGSTCYKHQREHHKRPLSPTESPEQNKRQRKTSFKQISNENLNHDLPHQISDPSKRQCLTRIENHFLPQLNSDSTIENLFTLTDRSLFRLFYFLFDGDLCYLTHLFPQRTCQDFYEQFISDSKYFSEHLSLTHQTPFVIRQSYRRRMPDGSTRAFLLYTKKNLQRTHSITYPKKNSNTTTTLKPAYQPCSHEGPCSSDNPQCHCIKMGTFCEKFCNCSIDCPRRFPGCACKGSCLFNNCLCCAEGRECDPDLCHNCGASLFFNQFNPSIKS